MSSASAWHMNSAGPNIDMNRARGRCCCCGRVAPGPKGWWFAAVRFRGQARSYGWVCRPAPGPMPWWLRRCENRGEYPEGIKAPLPQGRVVVGGTPSGRWGGGSRRFRGQARSYRWIWGGSPRDGCGWIGLANVPTLTTKYRSWQRSTGKKHRKDDET